MEEKWKTMRKSIVNKIMEEENIEKYFCVPEKGWSGYGKSQYRGIYWIRLSLSDYIIKSLKDTQYAGATAIHIMPYCITAEDVKKSVRKRANGFLEAKLPDNTEPPFVDYDPDTGNFHKKIKDSDEIRPQIVLVNNAIGGYGPGWGTVREADSSKYEKVVVNVLDKEKFEKDKENRLNAIKTDWYFPPIGERNENYSKIQSQKDFENMIETLLNDVKNAIQEEINKKITQQPSWNNHGGCLFI